MENNILKAGSNVDSMLGDLLLPTCRIKNDPVKETVQEIILPCTIEEEERRRKREEIILKTRFKNFSEGVDLFKRFEKVNIDEMNYVHYSWNYFDKPNKYELLTLISSIESIGLINPLILVKEMNNTYTIISGKSRVMALKNLFNNTKDLKYKFAPAFILNYDEVDQYFLRALIIDSNFSYRSLSKGVLITAAIERFKLYKKTKQFRSDTKIVEALAEEFMVSKNTIFNYLSLRKLREEVMVLVLENRIKLEAAKCLARVNLDMQIMILENFGIDHVNELHRIKYLTKQDNLTLPQLLKRIEVAKDLVPWKTKVTLIVNKYVAPKCLEMVGELKKYAITNFESKFKTKTSDKYCKVSVNYEDMKYYLEKEIISQKLIDMVAVKNYDELRRL
ncbi:MAG: ParB/RepB/Spo0J family partition protein [Oscillospiraceae bacterium]|nr:ParB/RepB/Spo0J family partition protein [Oscillospiraceae bacterium]